MRWVAILGVLTVWSFGCAEGTDTKPNQNEGGSGTGVCDAQGLVDCAGQCIDTESDAAHCGGCDAPCPPNATCVQGNCSIECPTGLIECEPGLCTDIVLDQANCGRCGNACLPEQSCTNAMCTCPVGRPDECPDACTDLMTDEENCGACGTVCTGMYESCIDGSCQLDCAGNALTECVGTCVDTFNDDMNCGACFNTCAQGYTCMVGNCECAMNGVCGACGIVDLGMTVPQTQTGSTTGLQDNLAPSCGSTGAPEAAFTFTAATADTYAFNTIGSSFDTTLYVLDVMSMCAELACDDDGSGLQSVVSVNLAANQQVLVVVDGFGSGDFGAYTLNVDVAPPCPTTNLGSTSPQTNTGNTTNSGAFHTGTCGGGGPEDTYEFTAPATGNYQFDTIGSAYDTVLYLRDATCGGTELACDDDSGGGGTSQFTVALTANQTVAIFADSFSGGGAYTLNISGPI